MGKTTGEKGFFSILWTVLTAELFLEKAGSKFPFMAGEGKKRAERTEDWKSPGVKVRRSQM